MTTIESAGAAAVRRAVSSRHQRVDDGVQVGSGGGVVEHQRRQRRAVEPPVGVEDLGTEPLDDGRQAGLTRARPPLGR